MREEIINPYFKTIGESERHLVVHKVNCRKFVLYECNNIICDSSMGILWFLLSHFTLLTISHAAYKYANLPERDDVVNEKQGLCVVSKLFYVFSNNIFLIPDIHHFSTFTIC